MFNRSVVRPTVTYGCRVWAAGEKGKPLAKTASQQLETVQNACLRRITGGYKRSPIQVLQRETQIPPLAQYMESQAQAQAVKVREAPAELLIAQRAFNRPD